MGLTLKIYPSFNPFELAEVKIPSGYQALSELEKEVTILANSPLRTVCNSSADKDKSEFWCSAECTLKKLVDIYGCADILMDLSPFNGTFFPVCSHKEVVLVREQVTNQVFIIFLCSLPSTRMFSRIPFYALECTGRLLFLSVSETRRM